MLNDLKISGGITFVVRRNNFSALSDFEIITLVPDAPAYWTGSCSFIKTSNKQESSDSPRKKISQHK